MEPFWNKLNLDKPPTVSWHCTVNDFDHGDFLKTMESVKRELESQTALRIEAALLSRLIYRMKSKLRNDKGLKNMEKINRALLNYLKLSLETDYEYLIKNTINEGNTLFLPTRQMLQYVLVRTQGYAKLMCRIENVAKEAGKCFKIRINLGQAWNMSLMAYAVISRIWLLSQHLVKKCCIWYNKMIKYHEKLKIIGVEWLKQNDFLPKDLKSWLNVPWIDEKIERYPESIGINAEMFNSILQQGDEQRLKFIETKEDFSGLLMTSIMNESLANESIIIDSELANKKESIVKMTDDVGKKISRDDFTSNIQRENTTPKYSKKRKIVEKNDTTEIPMKKCKIKSKKDNLKNQSIDIDKMKTQDDIVKLLALDSYSGLDKLRWNMIKKNITKSLVKLKKNENNLDSKKQRILIKKLIRSIQEWIS